MKKLGQNFCASLLIYASLNAMHDRPDLQRQRAQEHYKQISQSGLPQDIQQRLQGYFLSGKRHGHTDAITALGLSADGRYLATGSRDQTINILGLEPGTGFKSYPKQQTAISALSFLREGHHFAAGDASETIKIFNTQSTALYPIKELTSPYGTHALCFSPNNHYLASVSNNNSIHIWDVDNFTEIATFQGRSDQLVALGFSPDGKHLALGFAGKISIWHVDALINNAHISHEPAAQPIAQLNYSEDSIKALNFSPDGKYLMAVSRGIIHLWETANFSLQARFCPQNNDDCMLTAVCFTPDSSRIATGFSNRTIHLWEIVHLARAHTEESNYSISPIVTIDNLKTAPTALCFVPNNGNLICACEKDICIFSPFSSLNPEHTSLLIKIFRDRLKFNQLSSDEKISLMSLPKAAQPQCLQPAIEGITTAIETTSHFLEK